MSHVQELIILRAGWISKYGLMMLLTKSLRMVLKSCRQHVELSDTFPYT